MWNGLGGQGQVWNVINEEALKDALENLNSPKNSQVFCPTILNLTQNLSS